MKKHRIDRITNAQFDRLAKRLGEWVIDGVEISERITDSFHYIKQNKAGRALIDVILNDNDEFQQWCINFLNPLNGEYVEGAKFPVHVY